MRGGRMIRYVDCMAAKDQQSALGKATTTTVPLLAVVAMLLIAPLVPSSPAPSWVVPPWLMTTAQAKELGEIELPPGFVIELYASDVPNARSMAVGPEGVLFVGTRTAGNVYAVLDRDGDHRAERVVTLATGLDMPNGVALRGKDLYVAEADRIWRYANILGQLGVDPGRAGSPAADGDAGAHSSTAKLDEPVLVTDALPDQRGHSWKYIAFGPDEKLYVPVGAPCNICLPGDPFASILRMNPDGSDREVFARGVRNTVGFDWHPQTAVLWFTDNGRDYLGDNRPPDELNRAPQPGLHFGFPYVHGNDVRDPEYGDQTPPQEITPPVQELGPHVAALGMEFYTGESFPTQYHHQIFIAEHGSWNRSSKIGYRVTLVRLDGARATGYEVFASGWLQGERAWGRPVDLELLPDGSMLVSDDHADAIYRIHYQGEN